MSLGIELERAFPDHYRALILDNEVTVDAFVSHNPLPWARLWARQGHYVLADGYPCLLDGEQANEEDLNWDQVDLPSLERDLMDTAWIDLIAIGNNAAQGYPLAAALTEPALKKNSVVIYGESLPEQDQYEALGFSCFCPRVGLLPIILERAEAQGKKPALGFINTIQHNDENYHHPWPGR